MITGLIIGALIGIAGTLAVVKFVIPFFSKVKKAATDIKTDLK